MGDDDPHIADTGWPDREPRRQVSLSRPVQDHHLDGVPFLELRQSRLSSA